MSIENATFCRFVVFLSLFCRLFVAVLSPFCRLFVICRLFVVLSSFCRFFILVQVQVPFAFLSVRPKVEVGVKLIKRHVPERKYSLVEKG
jgi:hypothetical protein